MKSSVRNTWLIVETLAVFALLTVSAIFISSLTFPGKTVVLIVHTLAQGLWLYRFFVVGHEASHRKLFENRAANEIWGTFFFLPLLVPLGIYRHIHAFHHGFNRKDPHTSALDTYVTHTPPGTLKKAGYYALWYFSVFGGGFFLHSLISEILFLLLPARIGEKISPAFRNWTFRRQLAAIAHVCAGVALHAGVIMLAGFRPWMFAFLFPVCAFAWWLSIMVYIYHYNTTIGKEVRYNVRSLDRIPVLSWVLLNFNEHATHHQNPNIPWFELRHRKMPLPEQYAVQNQQTRSFWGAVLNQLKGPRIIHGEHADT